MQANAGKTKLNASANKVSLFFEKDSTDCVGHGSYTEEKEVMIYQSLGECFCQFWGRPFDEEENKKNGGVAISVYHYSGAWLCIERLVGYVMYLKSDAFESSKPFHFSRLNWRFSSIYWLKSNTFGFLLGKWSHTLQIVGFYQSNNV